MLEKIRGTKDVDEEYQDILEKAELAALVKNPWTLLLFRKKYRRARASITLTAAHHVLRQYSGCVLTRSALLCDALWRWLCGSSKASQH